jgi:hypothetical protein
MRSKRKGFDGLALLVQETLKHDPHGGHLFVFRRGECNCNRCAVGYGAVSVVARRSKCGPDQCDAVTLVSSETGLICHTMTQVRFDVAVALAAMREVGTVAVAALAAKDEVDDAVLDGIERNVLLAWFRRQDFARQPNRPISEQ